MYVRERVTRDHRVLGYRKNKTAYNLQRQGSKHVQQALKEFRIALDSHQSTLVSSCALKSLQRKCFASIVAGHYLYLESGLSAVPGSLESS